MLRLTCVCLALLVLAIGPLSAEDAPFSGPQPGEKLPPLPVLTGSDLGEVDFVAKADGKAVMFVFMNDFTRPSAGLTRVLMNYGEMRIDDGLFPATIRLTDDPSSPVARRRWTETDSASGISPDGKEGPGSYGLNRNVSLTVVVGDKGRVTASFALVQPSVTDAPKIIEEVSKLIGGQVPTEAELDFLAMNPDAAPLHRKQGAAPQDPGLRQKICAVLRTKSQPEDLVAAAADLEAYIGTDAARQRELGEASRLLLNQRYQGQESLVGDSPQGERFQAWAKQYGRPPADE